MVIREYGTENSRNLVFFQGSCEPWEEFRPAAEGLIKGPSADPDAALQKQR